MSAGLKNPIHDQLSRHDLIFEFLDSSGGGDRAQKLLRAFLRIVLGSHLRESYTRKLLPISCASVLDITESSGAASPSRGALRSTRTPNARAAS